MIVMMSKILDNGGVSTITGDSCAAEQHQQYDDVVAVEAEREDSGVEHGHRSKRDSRQRRLPNSSRRKSVYADITYVPGVKIKMYSPPRQRQKWGSDYELPHINWGDIFFDLFYVAGFYLIGQVLLDDPSGRGVLYAVGCFFPLMDVWKAKLFYDSWFVYSDDIYHPVFEMLLLILLGSCVGSIQIVPKMSDPSSEYMFGFCLWLTLVSIMDCCRYVEAYFFGRGQRKNIKFSSLSTLKAQLIPLAFYVAATVLSGIRFMSHSSEHRILAEGTIEKIDCSNTYDLPIVIILIGYVVSDIYHAITIVFFFPKHGEHKKLTIPVNIDFSIHRQGDWILLLLGESVLSLLIVNAEGLNARGIFNGWGSFLKTFYCGMIAVCLLQMLHFRSQPHDAHAHALRRSKNAGILFFRFFEVYSAALFGVGAGYKLLMYGVAKEVDSRRLFSFLPTDRWLAGEGDDYGCSPNGDEKKQMAAHLFSVSLGLVFLCLDAMNIAHTGLKKQVRKCEKEKTCPTTGDTKMQYNLKGILFALIPRVGLMIFTFTLSQWQTKPLRLAEIGCGVVACQLANRILGNIFFPDDRHHHHHHHHDNHHDGGVTDDDEEVIEDDDEEASVQSKENGGHGEA